MSCQESDKITEKLFENFEVAFCDDYELRGALAYHLLEPYEFWRFCKEDYSDYLDDRFEEICAVVEEQFWRSGGEIYDVRILCENAYGIKI